MKKSIVFVFAAVLALNTVIAANSDFTNKKNPKSVTEQISKLLESPHFDVSEEMLVTVTLVMNQEQEVVVLDVDTHNKDIVKYIKSRLNYEKLNIGTVGEHVTLPVRIIPGDK